MKWITIKLMKLQLKLVSKELKNEDNVVIANAYKNMIKNYKNTIMYLESHN